MLSFIVLSCLFGTDVRKVQDDWVGGLGVAGPVLDWGNKFWQSSDITYNNQGQISPIITTVNYYNWTMKIN